MPKFQVGDRVVHNQSRNEYTVESVDGNVIYFKGYELRSWSQHFTLVKRAENAPRKHAELIKAWADGAKIEFYSDCNERWMEAKRPNWHENYEYRIKPEKIVARSWHNVYMSTEGEPYTSCGWETKGEAERSIHCSNTAKYLGTFELVVEIPQ